MGRGGGSTRAAQAQRDPHLFLNLLTKTVHDLPQIRKAEGNTMINSLSCIATDKDMPLVIKGKQKERNLSSRCVLDLIHVCTQEKKQAISRLECKRAENPGRNCSQR